MRAGNFAGGRPPRGYGGGIAAQAETAGRVIDLTGAPFRHQHSDRIEHLKAEKAAFSRWLASMGGVTSARYAALREEALEMAGPDHWMDYMDMARAADEDHEAARRARRTAMARDLARRLDAAKAARLRRSAEIQLAAGRAAVGACLRQSAELKLAMEELMAHPRVAAALDAGLSAEASMSPAEISAEVRASMGLAPRGATRYEAPMPPVGALAVTLGLRS